MPEIGAWHGILTSRFPRGANRYRGQRQWDDAPAHHWRHLACQDQQRLSGGSSGSAPPDPGLQGAWPLLHFQRVDESFLRNLDPAELAHALLACLLPVEQLAFPADIAAIALSRHILPHGRDRLARDDAPANGGLDRDLEQVLRDQLLQLLAHDPPARLGLVAMDDDRERIDGLLVHEDLHLDEVFGLIAIHLIVKARIAARD